MRLRIILEPADEGGYTVFVPSLPGCISEGDTLQEARDNIREAIALYLEPAEELPVPEGAMVEEIVL
ncbi:MAG: type II toxin-antitoxin system HicB family antitoxin [Acidobacteriia bacterium]|nr:type II toxin-antitoxin system HicB family antitoxin [Terriglobia bacterium]